MKVFAKYVTVEAVHDKQVLTFLFLDFTDEYKEKESNTNG